MAAGLPTSTQVEIEFTAGVWTNVASRVREVSATKGSEDDASDTQPGVLTAVIENNDGAFTPDNPTSVYYPNLVEGKRIRWQVTKGTTSVRFVGRITSIVPVFPSEPAQSLVTITATDALGDLQRMTLRTMTEQAALFDGAVRCWPMRDTNAQPGAREILASARSLVPRNVSASGTVNFASLSDLGPDDASFVELEAGKGLWNIRAAFSVPIADAKSYHCWVKVQDGSYGELFAVCDDRRDRSLNYVTAEWTSASQFKINIYEAGVATYATSSTTTFDAGWHLITISMAGFPALYVDGAEPAIGGGEAFPSITMTHLSIGGSVNMGVGPVVIGADATGGLFYFLMNGPSTRDGALFTLEQRNNLGDFDVNFLTYTPTAPLVASPLRSLDRTAFEVLTDIANSDSGVFYAVPSTSDPQGIQVETDSATRSITVAITVDVERDMVGEPEVSRDVYGKAATATATSVDGVATAVDATLVGRYGSAEVEVETILSDDFALLAAAQRLLSRAQNSKLRISTVDVDLALASNDLYSSAFALVPGSRLRLSNLPSAYFGVTYVDGYITGWRERLTPEGYLFTFYLSPADAPPEGRWDDSTYGRWGFGDGVATNTSSATSSATSVAFQWTGGLTLSTSAGDYPLDLDWNGERVTVTTAPAGGSSPQTLTITRGVAPTVARAHNAGEAVDIWNAARWAM